MYIPSLSGELEAELLGCDCRGVLVSSTDGEREGLSHTLSWREGEGMKEVTKSIDTTLQPVKSLWVTGVRH